MGTIVLQYLEGSQPNLADEVLANSARTHLAAINALGVAHSDIKPASIINKMKAFFSSALAFQPLFFMRGSKDRARYRTDTGEKEVNLMELDIINRCLKDETSVSVSFSAPATAATGTTATFFPSSIRHHSLRKTSFRERRPFLHQTLLRRRVFYHEMALYVSHKGL